MQTEDERVEAEAEAQKRADLRASLERERDGYKTRGLTERADQVEEQLSKLDSRQDADGSGEAQERGTEERAPGAPLETAVESKPRTQAGRGTRKG